MDAWVWHQVGLELGDVNIECSIKPQRRREAGNDLGNEAIQVRVRGAFNVQVPERGVTLHVRSHSFSLTGFTYIRNFT